MDEEYLAKDADVSRLSKKGSDYTEKDKQSLRAKQLELLARVLPEYRRARDSGQIEISTTPFYHPILPLLCDTDIARQANPETPLPSPAFRHPEDAREQLVRARAYHERLFGAPPAGLWPSEGSVSNEALSIAADLGFRWFASDEGVLGRTLNIGFGRDAEGVPSNAERLYAPLRVNLGEREIAGIFRDHYLSDLVGFVYSRMDAGSAAEDLYRRIRTVAERVHSRGPLTLPLILDGENAWEYYAGNGREFLRQFYGRISRDADIRALTAREASASMLPMNWPSPSSTRPRRRTSSRPRRFSTCTWMDANPLTLSGWARDFTRPTARKVPCTGGCIGCGSFVTASAPNDSIFAWI